MCPGPKYLDPGYNAGKSELQEIEVISGLILFRGPKSHLQGLTRTF